MSDAESKKSAELAPELRDMKIEEGAASLGGGDNADATQVKVEDSSRPSPLPLHLPPRNKPRIKSQSPLKQQPSDASSSDTDTHEEVLGGDITLKMEHGKAPKLARTASQKIVARAPPLYLDLPDATEEAKRSFAVLPECTYSNKHLGTTEHAFECDCSEEWDAVAKVNHACGDDSDCINRATKMECVGDCGCGRKCQNQRFLRKRYANVNVIKTEKKGFGLRTNTDLKAGDFVFEYIGEVIDERTFRRRMVQYDEEGIKHFYFMSLTKSEFVDATRKGNLGRFCNHSCNPNCFVDKWVVGDKLRMGIFAERKIKAGEELVFNYNVDRYGADPQPCYCGEPNCTGFIGGKTQTGNATKLSHATIEALGIDDGDGWDTAVAKKPRRKRANEDDEEYVNDLQPRSLEENGVSKVMAALGQGAEKWITVKLLDRLQRSRDERVGHLVIRLHGYQYLRKTITTWKDDPNVVLQVLDILHHLPRITRNKIQDSKIEEVVQQLTDECNDERVVDSARELLIAWCKLEIAYRIPRKVRDPNVSLPVRTENHFERREKGRERSRSRSKSPTTKVPSSAPSAPRVHNAPKGPAAFFNAPRAPRPIRPPFNPSAPLPNGWFQATSPENGATYYYTRSGETRWIRPTQAAPNEPKAKTDAQKLQDIISSITAQGTPNNRTSASATPQPVIDETKDRNSKSDKWRELSQDKLEKLYESNISTHVMSVTSRYRKDFEKDDVKRLSKEVAKKLVRGDFKSGRVKDPKAPVGSKHEKTIKAYVKDFMDKAVRKKGEREKGKIARSGSKAEPKAAMKGDPMESEDGMLGLSDNEGTESHDLSPTESSMAELKRKRDGETEDPGSPKKSRIEVPPAPPPPPPPPAEDMPLDLDDSTLTPLEEYSTFVRSTVEEDVNGDAVSGLIKTLHDRVVSPMQLATPPTNGTGGHGEFPNGSCNEKPSYLVNGDT